MHRRSFLVGLGAILTAPYVAKVQLALAQQATPTPLITEAEASRTLIAERMSRGFTLYFDVTRDPEPLYTYRDMLWEFWGEDFYDSLTIKDENKSRLTEEYGLVIDDLDDIAPFDFYEEQWCEKHDPSLEVFSFLDDLDLGPTNEDRDDLLGALDFIEGECPGSTYYAVEARDELTLHLLQARLLDVGKNVFISIRATPSFDPT